MLRVNHIIRDFGKDLFYILFALCLSSPVYADMFHAKFEVSIQILSTSDVGYIGCTEWVGLYVTNFSIKNEKTTSPDEGDVVLMASY